LRVYAEGNSREAVKAMLEAGQRLVNLT